MTIDRNSLAEFRQEERQDRDGSIPFVVALVRPRSITEQPVIQHGTIAGSGGGIIQPGGEDGENVTRLVSLCCCS